MEKKNYNVSDIVDLFDQAAEKGTRHVDSLINSGIYKRGKLFVETVVKTVDKNKKILDYGCGAGRITKMVAEKGYILHGCDPSSENIRLATAQNNDSLNLSFSLLKDNGESFDSSSFDAIICSSVIEFVSEYKIVLNNYHKILKDDGVLLISFANKSSFWRKYAAIRFKKKNAHFQFQLNVWNIEGFKKLLNETGFVVNHSPIFFESPFEKIPVIRNLNSKYLGTLGLVIAKKK